MSAGITAITKVILPGLLALVMLLSPFKAGEIKTPEDFFKKINREKFEQYIEQEVIEEIINQPEVYRTPEGGFEEVIIDYEIHNKIFDTINNLIKDKKVEEILKKPDFIIKEYEFISKIIIDKDMIKETINDLEDQSIMIIQHDDGIDILFGPRKLWDFLDKLSPF